MTLQIVGRAVSEARDHMLEAQIAAQREDWAELVAALERAEEKLRAALADVTARAAA